MFRIILSLEDIINNKVIIRKKRRNICLSYSSKYFIQGSTVNDKEELGLMMLYVIENNICINIVIIIKIHFITIENESKNFIKPKQKEKGIYVCSVVRALLDTTSK